MKLRILGCGTSTGVPVVACNCKVCSSSNPKNKRLRTSALIEAGPETRILIDAGPDFRQQALTAGIERLAAVLFTHAHADHVLGVDDLRALSFRYEVPISLFATTITFAAIKEVFRYIFEPNPNYEGGLITKATVHEIADYTPFTVAGVEILPFPLGHGSSTVTGFKIGDLVYATDCNSIPPRSREIMQGAPHLILDGLGLKQHATHYTVREAAEVAQKLGAQQTVLIHMTHSIDYAEVQALLPPNVELAYDGMEIEFQGAGNI